MATVYALVLYEPYAAPERHLPPVDEAESEPEPPKHRHIVQHEDGRIEQVEW